MTTTPIGSCAAGIERRSRTSACVEGCSPKNERAEPGVDGGEQQRHRRHRGVGEPVGHRPRRGRLQPRVGLVGFGVPAEVGAGIGEGDHHDGRIDDGREAALPVLTRATRAPEALGLVGADEHDEVDALAVARARTSPREVEHGVDHVLVDRIGKEPAHHAAAANDLVELHPARSPLVTVRSDHGRGGAYPGLCTRHTRRSRARPRPSSSPPSSARSSSSAPSSRRRRCCAWRVVATVIPCSCCPGSRPATARPHRCAGSCAARVGGRTDGTSVRTSVRLAAS